MQGLHKLVHTSYQNLASTQKYTNNVHVALLHNKWQHASCQIKYVSPSANITNSRRASLLSYYAVCLHDCLVTGYHDVQLYMHSTILFGLWTDMISATKNSTQYHPLASWVAYLEKKVQLFYLTKQMNLCKYLVTYAVPLTSSLFVRRFSDPRKCWFFQSWVERRVSSENAF